MTTSNLSPGPGPGPDKPVRIVRDECWELVTRLPEFTALVQLGRVHGPSSTHLRERGEPS